MTKNRIPDMTGDQADAMAAADLRQMRAENDRLAAEVTALRREVDDLARELDLETCHAAGLAAQLKALIGEGDACPNKAAHPLLERVPYTNDRTGEAMTKTRAYPLYRAAFDAEAEACGIDHPELLRS